jgi:hypothetical protein
MRFAPPCKHKRKLLSSPRLVRRTCWSAPLTSLPLTPSHFLQTHITRAKPCPRPILFVSLPFQTDLALFHRPYRPGAPPHPGIGPRCDFVLNGEAAASLPPSPSPHSHRRRLQPERRGNTLLPYLSPARLRRFLPSPHRPLPLALSLLQIRASSPPTGDTFRQRAAEILYGPPDCGASPSDASRLARDLIPPLSSSPIPTERILVPPFIGDAFSQRAADILYGPPTSGAPPVPSDASRLARDLAAGVAGGVGLASRALEALGANAQAYARGIGGAPGVGSGRVEAAGGYGDTGWGAQDGYGDTGWGGGDDFSPSAEETEALVRDRYAVRRNLLVRFTEDELDQSVSIHTA